MCSRKEKTTINNINRILIAVIGGLSTTLDGISAGDVLCCLSMLIWLFQSEFSAVEEKALICYKRHWTEHR